MVKAAIGQICSGNSMSANLEQCVTLAGKAAAAGASILFLPEAADYIATSSDESVSLAKPMDKSPFVQGLRDAAKHNNLAIHVGIHDPAPPQQHDRQLQLDSNNNDDDKEQKLWNSTIYINPDGTINRAGTYNKLHLFDFGSMRESASTQAGKHFTPPFPSPIGLLGSLICFDMRFPEAALHLAKPPAAKTTPTTTTTNGTSRGEEAPKAAAAEVILYPSAFTVSTGLAHWEPLLRSRAIETQSWVVAAAQVGRHEAWPKGKRVSYGHSMVIDPWGKVVVELKGVEDVNRDPNRSDREGRLEKEGRRAADDGKEAQKEEEGLEERWEAQDGAVCQLGVFDVDLDHVKRVREQMPLLRRTDAY